MAKAPAKTEEKKTGEAAEGEEQPPKKKGKLPLILGLAVLLAGGGGGAWFFMFKDKGAEAAPQQAKPQPLKPPVFVPLDAFTVNLASENEQYLQMAATLRVLDQQAADAIKQYMPEIRHKALVLLSSKQASAISSGEGRERLAEELRQTTNNVLLAAAGRPARPIVLDVPKTEDAPPPAAAEEAKPAEDAAKPEEGAPAGEKPPLAVPAAVPATAPAAKPATVLSKAAADDPVQSVYFTSFIIQ